jgi:hypothetical protein
MHGRDRHARTAHADSDRRRRPSSGFRLRSPVSFDRVVRDALAEVAEPVAQALEGVPVDVIAIPDDERPQHSALVSVEGTGGRIRRVLVHRRAAEQRAADRGDLTDLLRDALEVAVAGTLGIDLDD